jgi:hypothetical protein
MGPVETTTQPVVKALVANQSVDFRHGNRGRGRRPACADVAPRVCIELLPMT